MIGKFENEELLLKSYNDLEKEFTKKCQELARVRKELDDIKVVGEEVHVSEDEVLIPQEIVGLSDEVGFTDDECGVLEQVEETKEDETQNYDITSCNENEDKLSFRLRANEFLSNNAEARNYSREISKILMKDKSLLACADPFKVAYALALKERAATLNEDKKIKVEDKIVADEVSGDDDKMGRVVSILGRKTASATPVRITPKYRTMDDARSELIRRFS